MNLALQIFFRTLLELSLFIFLQLNNPLMDTYFNIVSVLTSVFCALYIILFLVQFCRILNNPKLRDLPINRQRYGSLFYELNLSTMKSFMALNYPLFVMLRKPVISAIMVLAYEAPTVQSSFLMVLSLLFFVYTIKFNPFKTVFERRVNLFIETQLLVVYLA